MTLCRISPTVLILYLSNISIHFQWNWGTANLAGHINFAPPRSSARSIPKTFQSCTGATRYSTSLLSGKMTEKTIFTAKPQRTQRYANISNSLDTTDSTWRKLWHSLSFQTVYIGKDFCHGFIEAIWYLLTNFDTFCGEPVPRVYFLQSGLDCYAQLHGFFAQSGQRLWRLPWVRRIFRGRI